MKTVTQIGHFLKNEPGALSEVSELLGANGINIIGLYFTARGKEGRLQFVANDPDRAATVMKSAGYDIDMTDVIACVVPHHPGGLNAVLKPLRNARINVDYIYPCLGTGSMTIVVLGVDSVPGAVKTLGESWIHLMGEELYHL